MPSVDVEGILKSEGLGVPAGLGLLAFTLLYGTFPGVEMFDAITSYGKLGVFLLLLVSSACWFAAGYTYALIDTDWWLETEDDQ